MRWPINKQVVVMYHDSAWSRLFHNYVDLCDFREPCTKGNNCQYKDEHYTFDGQFFYKKTGVSK